MPSEPATDFFISYTQVDCDWAEWLAWQLELAGYSAILQVWDSRPGSNFVLDMQRASASAHRTIAVLSPEYFSAYFTQAQWAAAFARDPTGEIGALLPVRVRECNVEGLLGPIVYIDLVGQDEQMARETLLCEVDRKRKKPNTAPKFPAASSSLVTTRAAYPGASPPFWHVPHLRNAAFTGRDALLEELRSALISEQSAALTQAISGLGGVGKTQLALEYSYRYGPDYGGVWWLRSETTETLITDYAALASAAGLPERGWTDWKDRIKSVLLWLGQQERPWLIVFDNAPAPEGVRDYLPRRPVHHVLITSRNPTWRSVAKPLSVLPFERRESVAFLRKRTGSDEESAAAELAEALGDLPLALEQAGAYVEAVGFSISDYIVRYRAHRTQLLSRSKPSTDYPETVATTWSLAFSAVQRTAPAGAELLNLLAFFAPEAIPSTLILEGGAHFPRALSESVASALLLDDALAALRR